MTTKVSKVLAYQVKVTLRHTRPPIWRRLVLPGLWHLGRVHEALQVAMGWTDSHLHEFEVGGERLGVPDPDWDDDEVRRESTVRLHEVLLGPQSRLRYLYDFGDGWEHDVVVEELREPAQLAACLAGRRACPPEDCGGPWRYAELLGILAEPEHPEHEQYVEWLGGSFDPAAFDQKGTDAALRQL